MNEKEFASAPAAPQMKLLYQSEISRLKEYNSSFDTGVLRVCYHGKNRNGSFISKDSIERCINSIYNCPVVCRYDREENEIGAHDVEIVKDSDGSIRMVNVTEPVGVIPESAKYWWEKREEEDGSTHEYLNVETLLWKRQEAYQKIKNDGITDQSMEITVKSGHIDESTDSYMIDDFEFTAFCLLGTAEPCFESAALETFSMKDIKAQFNYMMDELKDSMIEDKSSDNVDVCSNDNSEGGESGLDRKKELMQQYNITDEMINFDLNDFTEEELEEKFKAIAEDNAERNSEHGAEPAASEEGEGQSDEGADEGEDKFALIGQVIGEIQTSLSAETVSTEFGEFPRYWYWDCDMEKQEVYGYDYNDWHMYGFSFSMDGDNAVVDFNSKKRMKIAVEEFDEGEQASVFSVVMKRMSEAHNATVNDVKKEYADKAAEMQTEIDTLREFKTSVEKRQADQERSDLFAMFEDMVGVEAFDTLVENAQEYSIEELEEKCYAIKGRMMSEKAKFSVDAQKAPKLPIEGTQHNGGKDDEPYGGLFQKYNIAD